MMRYFQILNMALTAKVLSAPLPSASARLLSRDTTKAAANAKINKRIHYKTKNNSTSHKIGRKYMHNNII